MALSPQQTNQLQQLAASGNYAGLFATAEKFGALDLLTTSQGWTSLGLKDPGNVAGFDALYKAFQPYETKLQGKTAVGATGYQGKSAGADQVVWGDPSNWQSDALANYQAATKAGSVASNEAMLAAANKQVAASPTLQAMRASGGSGPQGGGGGPGERAQQNLLSDAPNLATFMGSDQTALAANRASNIGIGEVVGLAAAGFGGALAAGAGAASAGAGTASDSALADEAASLAATPGTGTVGYNAAAVASDLSGAPAAGSSDLLASTAPSSDIGSSFGTSDITTSAGNDLSAFGNTPSLPTLPEQGVTSGINWQNVLTKAGERAGVGAVESGVRGGNPVEGAALGALGGGVSGVASGLGAPGVVANLAGNVAAGTAGSVISKQGSTMPSATNTQAAPGMDFNPLNPTGSALGPGGVPPLSATANQGMNFGLTSPTGNAVSPTDLSLAVPAVGNAGSSSGSGGLLGDVGTLLSDAASNPLVQFGAPALYGLTQANAANKVNQTDANTLMQQGKPYVDAGNATLNAWKKGQLTPSESNVVTSLTNFGKGLINDPTTKSLYNIASTAFSNYNSQTLTPADQASLDQAIAQAQAIGSQALGAQNWSSNAPVVNFQISQMASQYKQDLLTKQFQTGQSAYDQWLSTTTEGQNAITSGLQFAVTSLSNNLSDALNLQAAGMGPIEDAINLEMTSNADTAAIVGQLISNVTTAYAKSTYAGGGANSPSSNVGSAAGKVVSDIGNLFGGSSGGDGLAPISTSDIASQYITGSGTNDSSLFDSAGSLIGL